MKTVFCVILFILIQVQLAQQREENPLAYKSFIVVKNSLDNQLLNYVQVSFDSSWVKFKSCHISSTIYKVKNNSFLADNDWRAYGKFCEMKYEKELQKLFRDSVSFDLSENGLLTFKDKDGNVLLILSEQPFIPL